jgi:hypothetical protein
MIPPTCFAFPAAIGFAASHRAPEAVKVLAPEARRRLADAAHAARLARMEAALRGTVDAPVVLPPERLPPGHLLAAEAAMAEAIEAVTRDLRRALEAGDLRAVGFRADGSPVPIPPAYWRAPVRWGETAGAPVMADPFERAAKGDLVPVDGAFVEPGLECGAVARWCGTSPPEPPKVYSREALRGWFLLRVRTWPPGDPSPSEADDYAAAVAYFGRRLPRDAFRAARRDLAPPCWLRPGPRRRRNPRD